MTKNADEPGEDQDEPDGTGSNDESDKQPEHL